MSGDKDVLREQDEDKVNAAQPEITDEDDGASGDPDAGLDDEGQAAAGEDGDASLAEDSLGDDEGQAGQGSAEVRQTRGQTRHQVLANRAKAAEEETAKLRREFDEFRQQAQRNNGPDLMAERQRQRQTELDEARERDRINGTNSYTDVRLRQQQEDFDARINQIQFATADATDRSSFEALASRNPAVAGLRDEVEQRLAEERRRGFNFPRETVAKFLLGEKALKGAPAARTRQQNKADAGIRREAVRTPNGNNRSDVTRTQPRGDDRTARAKRLENQQI